MSRKVENMNSRCPICGGRMKLVNVTWVDTFQTPEAVQYDLSVSRRKASNKKVAVASSQEMMCAACCRRIPFVDENGKETEMVKNMKKQARKEKRKNRKDKGSVIGWIIFAVIFAIIAYFAYKYRDIVGVYTDKIVVWFNAINDFIAKFLHK